MNFDPTEDQVSIRNAIGEVCGDYPGGLVDLYELDEIGDCRIAARRSIDRQLSARTTDIRLAAK